MWGQARLGKGANVCGWGWGLGNGGNCGGGVKVGNGGLGNKHKCVVCMCMGQQGTRWGQSNKQGNKCHPNLPAHPIPQTQVPVPSAKREYKAGRHRQGCGGNGVKGVIQGKEGKGKGEGKSMGRRHGGWGQ